MELNVDDVIVAVSSAAGFAPVGIVRVSGPGACHLADRLLRPAAGVAVSSTPGFRRVACEVVLDAASALPAAALVFRAPRSYTRQDLVEIHTIGAPAVLEAVVRRCVELGARRAQPGEFTARAFLAGAMDLTRAEGVAAVISAETDAQLAAARRIGDGYLRESVERAMDELARLTALVEADIDFAEEPIEFITPEQLGRQVDALLDALTAMTKDALSAERFDAAPRVLLFGRPNAGKSSLLNALSATDRAICSAVAGTTRDVISAPVRLGRLDGILLDGAGVDDRDTEVMTLARQMVLAESQRVDLVCVVVDAADDPVAAEADLTARLGGRPHLVVANKIDLLQPAARVTREQRFRGRGRAVPLFVSATSGEGMAELRAALASRLAGSGQTVGASVLVLTARQRQALADAVASLGRATDLAGGAACTADVADLVAFELRDALDALGRITGRVTTDDLLGRIFADFCIGK
ncbi:MAG: tRNA modification GTPase [Phycisphaerales bacterium]|nr:MAG: tRNA modification GTPase [Phycisphaerales bacterium]